MPCFPDILPNRSVGSPGMGGPTPSPAPSGGGGGGGIWSNPSMPASPMGGLTSAPTRMNKGGPVVSPIANKGYRKLA